MNSEEKQDKQYVKVHMHARHSNLSSGLHMKNAWNKASKRAAKSLKKSCKKSQLKVTFLISYL